MRVVEPSTVQDETSERAAQRAIGIVRSLYRWPVKSVGGEAIRATRLDARGLAGDRTHALFVTNKRGEEVPLTAREAPRMLAWSAGYPECPGDAVPLDAPPTPVLTDPAGRTHRWEPDLAAALSEDLGRPVTLVRETAGLPDLPSSVLITTESSHREVEASLGIDLDLRRYRTNLHLDLSVDPYSEEGWQDRVLQVGEATFDVLHPCIRCVIPTRDPDTQRKNPELLRWLTRERGGRFGVNARARGEARVAAGDPVYLV